MRRLHEDGKHLVGSRLFRAKLVILGEARVGKTTMCKRLRENVFAQHDMTDGIDMQPWTVPLSRKTVRRRDKKQVTIADGDELEIGGEVAGADRRIAALHAHIHLLVAVEIGKRDPARFLRRVADQGEVLRDRGATLDDFGSVSHGCVIARRGSCPR